MHVEPQVLDVLAYLVTHRDRLVPKTELLDAVWGDHFVSDSALTSRIKSARSAIGDDATAGRALPARHDRGAGRHRKDPAVARAGPPPRQQAQPAGPASGAWTFVDLAEVVTNPAVALFLDRAQRNAGEIRLDAHGAADLVALRRALDGLPLTLELAAGRAGTFGAARPPGTPGPARRRSRGHVGAPPVAPHRAGVVLRAA